MKRLAVGVVGVLLAVLLCACEKPEFSLKPVLDVGIQAGAQVKPDPRRITSEETDFSVPRVDQLFTYGGLHISEKLQDAMEQYEGEDVLFRIVAEVPYPEEGGTECFVFAVQAGAANISSSLLSSDLMPYREACGSYFMDVTYDILNKMIEHRGYILRLAPPERIEGYSEMISDSLTVALDKMGETESIHVAVVCRADQYNSFLGDRGISNNVRYNKEYFEPVTGDITDQMMIEYIDEIVERNGLTDKRVKNPQVPDTEPIDHLKQGDYYGYSGAAGFEAVLTKEEVLALAKDPAVKVIHPCP